MAKYPTRQSVLADIAAGLSEEEAIQKAARELADAIDEEAVESLRALYDDLDARGRAPRGACKGGQGMSDHDDLIDLADRWFLVVRDVPAETPIVVPAGELLSLTAAVFASADGTFCGSTGIDARGGRVYCTRERGHAGRHVATVGPYQVGLPVLAEWAPDAPPHGPEEDTTPE